MDDFVNIAHEHRACYPAGEKMVLMREDQSRNLLEGNRDMRIRLETLEFQRRAWHIATIICCAVSGCVCFLIGLAM